MKDFFLCPFLSWQIFSCLSGWEAVLVKMDIPAGVQRYLPCFCPTALFHGRYCFPCAPPRPSSPRNKSKTLLDTRAQAVWSAHARHSCPLHLSGPWVLHQGQGQTDGALCARRCGQICLSSFTLFIQENGQPCWLHRLQYLGSMNSPT